MTPQRISLVTLGVRDMVRSRAFYEALGWTPVASPPEVTFYRLDGMAMGLFGLDALANDQGRPDATLGTGAITLAQNFPDKESVDRSFRTALAAGAKKLKDPEGVFWGGYSGYYADPDGHVWEVAYNPFWPIASGGQITIPDAP